MDSNVIINGGTISSYIYAIVLKPGGNNLRASLTINGGKFEGAKAFAINNPKENDTTNVIVTINGGTFSGEIYKNPDNASAWALTDKR